MLQVNDEQSKKLDELQSAVDEKLDAVLTETQQKELEEMQGGGFRGGFPQPGQILSAFVQARLEVTDEQKAQLDEFQTDIDTKLAAILDDRQLEQLDQMQRFNPGGRGGRGGFGGGRGGPGGFPGGFTPPSGKSLFRAYRYPADYAGLAGKDLAPGKTLQEIAKEEEQARTAQQQEERDRGDEQSDGD
jgi:hypothetical protein